MVYCFVTSIILESPTRGWCEGGGMTPITPVLEYAVGGFLCDTFCRSTAVVCYAQLAQQAVLVNTPSI